MSNEELFRKLEKQFPKKDLKVFCNISAFMYDELYTEFKRNFPNDPNEFLYEKEWYLNKYVELAINPKNAKDQTRRL